MYHHFDHQWWCHDSQNPIEKKNNDIPLPTRNPKMNRHNTNPFYQGFVRLVFNDFNVRKELVRSPCLASPCPGCPH
jgi:hypothetical protein